MGERHALAELQDRAALTISFVQQADNRYALSIAEPVAGEKKF